MYVLILVFIVFILLCFLPRIQEGFVTSFMPSIEVLAQQKEIEVRQAHEEREKRKQKSALSIEKTIPKEQTYESSGEFRDRQLTKMFNQMHLDPSQIDIPIPYNLFDHIPDEEQRQLVHHSLI